VGVALAYSIPEDQIDPQKIYWGSPANFDKPGEVDLDQLIKATPEYEEIKKNKLERGSGKYWILLNEASERAQKAILAVAEVTDYDLVTAVGYLKGLKPSIAADDITDLVLKELEKAL
jgi:Skp family chaperone for outer membrane proteins